MKNTKNYGFNKPESTDFYDVNNLNDNMDAIDEKLKELEEPTYTEATEITALTSGEKLKVALGKIAKAISTLIDHIATKATSSTKGHVKLSDSSAVTDSTGLALPATEKNASIEGTLAHQCASLNETLTKKQDKLTNPLTQSDVINNLTSTDTNKPLSAAQGKTLKTLISEKQDSLIFDTYVNTETTDSNGSITLGIDISGYSLKQKPKCAFLQGQHTSFSNYIYSYDNSTSTLVVFVVNYGTSFANTAITNRYGVMIVK